MKQYPADRIRNVGLFSHGGAGKTSLAEALLFDTKAITRLGRVEDGNTVSDFDPDEIKRHISVSAASPRSNGATQDQRHRRPRLRRFPGRREVRPARRRRRHHPDGRLGRRRSRHRAGLAAGRRARYCLGCIFINKMDRENADFGARARLRRARPSARASPRSSSRSAARKAFKGIVDLLGEQALHLPRQPRRRLRDRPDPGGARRRVRDLPAATRRGDRRARRRADDALPRRRSDLQRRVDRRPGDRASQTGPVVPVLCGSATGNRGVQPLLDAIVDYLPPASTRHGERAAERRRRVELKADPNGPAGGVRLQDAGRPARRPRDLLPRLLRHLQVELATSSTRARASPSASASSSTSAARSTSTPTPSAPATSARSASWRRVVTGDTISRRGQADRRCRRSRSRRRRSPPRSIRRRRPTSTRWARRCTPGRRRPDPAHQPRPGHRRDDHFRPWRAARPDRARADDAPLRRQRRPRAAAGRLPRDDLGQDHRRVQAQEADRRRRPVRPRLPRARAAPRTANSSSPSGSSAARCRATSSRRSRRASARRSRRVRWPATRSSTSGSR